ncbi:unnamed protein product [Schistocephalus solidus]|nr:unnamed protein product [Schistocephalus solidus]
MAIEPGDPRLPRYVEGSVEPVYRKKSFSKGVALYLLHRDYWSNAETNYRKRSEGKYEQPHECTGVDPPDWKPGYEPSLDGWVEGIAHVNPWLLEFGSYVYAQVEAHYRFYRSELDAYDFEIDETVFSARVQLNPPPCAREGFSCFANPPHDINSYSAPLRQLYEKLGGPAGARSMQHELLTPYGVIPGHALNNRSQYTFVPQTKAVKSSGFPDHPYVTYNFPFRFDINRGPDSVYMKSNKPAPVGNHPVPKTRHELFMDAVYGFANDASDSDPEAPDTSEDDDDFLPRIRHPREPVKKKHGVRKIDLRMQNYKDRFHKDCYPWRPRQHKAPKAGIYWTVTVYATMQPTAKPIRKHTATMTIRKLSFLPRMIALHHRIPPTVTTDYCLAVGPRANTDAGVITLNGELDKMIYGPGDPVTVYIKVHNTSNRVVQQLTVEVNQCIRVASWSNRVWRITICRREITAENPDAQMPILPATEQVELNVRMNPFCIEKQYRHLFYDKWHKRRLPKVPIEEEAYTLRMPTTPGIFYAVEQPGRHEPVPLTFILRRKPAFSTLPGVIDNLIENYPGKLPTIREPLEREPKDLWTENPYGRCRCFRRPRDENSEARCKRMPPDEPYQIPVHGYDIYDEDEERDPQMAARNELAPRCPRCGGAWPSNIQPVYINYEVVVSAVLRPQEILDPLAQDSLLKELGLGSGLALPPKGHIEGPDGPRISIPLLYSLTEPVPEVPIPVANYNVDQRQDRPPKFPPKPKVWEPSDGKGLFVKNQERAAPCPTGDEIKVKL